MYTNVITPKIVSNQLDAPMMKHLELLCTTSGTPNLATTCRAASAIVNATFTWLAGVATITTGAAHHLATGMVVAVSSVTSPLYNKLDFVVTVTGATTFTYPLPNNPGAAATTDGKVAYNLHAQWACFIADAGNSAAVSLGPDINADLYPIAAGQSFTVPIPQGSKFDLADYYIASTAASQKVRILFF